MSASLTPAAKRMAKERKDLEEASNQETDQDYVVFFQDHDLLQFDAYVIAPDTIYRYRLVKLHFDIPNTYPTDPPKVTFIQYSGGRIHPNLYVDGKVCLSILNTWDGQEWVPEMTCHAVLITIRSLLDDEPFKHEPDENNNTGVNNPEFNNYVEYRTWISLLTDYLWPRREANPEARAWLDRYVCKNGPKMLREYSKQQHRASVSHRKSVKDVYCGPDSPGEDLDYPGWFEALGTAILAAAARGGAIIFTHTPSESPPLKRKADHQQPSTTGEGSEDAEKNGKKQAKSSAAPKPKSPPETIDLTSP
ncbi:hypothetical protein KVR01_008179 [Diaporthe batatas]|uniref:uncharacterized protein n=1 Tax=Diaporthe batatas TaxID=748121 RepID=UPI001D03B197|nr:uncharacterized protein KVR01_008179 [Diaporthe batatas]KAG8162414.1 hypothetical protein KVR01_008179 [Diaporthe batatas]